MSSVGQGKVEQEPPLALLGSGFVYNSAELNLGNRGCPGDRVERESSWHGNVCYTPGWEHVSLKCRVSDGFSWSLGLDGWRHGKTRSLLALPSSVLITETLNHLCVKWRCCKSLVSGLE